MPWEAHMLAPHGFDMNVRCGSLADILGCIKRRLLYPWKQTFCGAA